jgi:hypothetical protein
MNEPFLPDSWDSQTALSELEYLECSLSELSDLSTQEEDDVSDFDMEALWELTEHDDFIPPIPLDINKIVVFALDRDPEIESLQSSPPLQPIPRPKPPEFDIAIDLLEYRKSLPLVPKPSQTIDSSKLSPLQVVWILGSALATDIWHLVNVPIYLPIERFKFRQFSSVANTKRVINSPQSGSIQYLQTTLIRQGDVLIVPLTDKISHWLNHPIDLAFWKDISFRKRPNLVLAEGEVTGHKHRISDGKAELYERDGVVYLRVLSPTALLTHEEHHAVTIPQGNWAVRVQREYEPNTENWRSVAD